MSLEVMWGQKKLLLDLIVKNSTCSLQVRNSKKNPVVVQLIKRKKEESRMYGGLLENKKQKIKRLRYEQSGGIKLAEPTVDSELSWVMKSTSKLKVIKFSEFNNENNIPNLHSTTSNQDVVQIPIEKKSGKLALDFQEKFSEQLSRNDVSESAKQNISEVKIDKPFEQKSNIESILMQNLMKDENNQSVEYNSEINTKTASKIFSLPFNTEQQENFKKQLQSFPIFPDKPNQGTDNDENMHDIVQNYYLNIKYPTVSKILAATMSDESKAIIENWKKGMIEKLGEKGFETHQAELLDEGVLFHSSIMSYLTNKDFVLADHIKPSFNSLREVFTKINGIKVIESDVAHPNLIYKGKVDCVADYRGVPCVIDWKKSSKKKLSVTSTFDAPLQLASYIGAINADSKYPFQIKKGLLVVAYGDGTEATVHEFEENLLQHFWNLWMERLRNYYKNLINKV